MTPLIKLLKSKGKREGDNERKGKEDISKDAENNLVFLFIENMPQQQIMRNDYNKYQSY